MIEVHPEVCFATLAGHPLAHTKRSWVGAEERRRPLASVGIQVPEDTRHPRQPHPGCATPADPIPSRSHPEDSAHTETFSPFGVGLSKRLRTLPLGVLAVDQRSPSGQSGGGDPVPSRFLVVRTPGPVQR